MDRLGLPATARASLGLYNRSEDLEHLAVGRLKKDALVLLASVGAGITAGTLLLRWSL